MQEITRRAHSYVRAILVLVLKLAVHKNASLPNLQILTRRERGARAIGRFFFTVFAKELSLADRSWMMRRVFHGNDESIALVAQWILLFNLDQIYI